MVLYLKFKATVLLALTFAFFQTTYSIPLSSEEYENQDDSIDLSIFGSEIFGEPDFKTGSIISAYNLNGNTKINPEELGSYLEGDLLIPNGDLITRNGIRGKSFRWPNGIVPYKIEGKFTKNDLSVIRNAFDQYHNKTCIRFQKRKNERNYISIISKNTGCWSSVGRIGGRQRINLQSPKCLEQNGTAMHELMHVLGFFHEHNRYERDEYIKVLHKNVKPSMLSAFRKISSKKINSYNLPYDLNSVMHYSNMAHSRNGKETILVLDKTRDSSLMGQRIGFSESDIAKINAMYKCDMEDEEKERNHEYY